jgi:hypothetical protein
MSLADEVATTTEIRCVGLELHRYLQKTVAAKYLYQQATYTMGYLPGHNCLSISTPSPLSHKLHLTERIHADRSYRNIQILENSKILHTHAGPETLCS